MVKTRRQRRFRLLREERGAISIWFIFAMVPLIGLLGVAIDLGLIAAARLQLQRGVDAGSHAGVKAMRDGLWPVQVRSRARIFADLNVTLADAEFEPHAGTAQRAAGVWTFSSASDFSSVDPEGRVPAVEVDAVIDPLRLTFLPILGISSARVTAHAVSIGKKRELVIVQDCSGSFRQEFEQARHADEELVQTMSDQNLLGDRVGVVSFSTNVSTEIGLSLLRDRSAQVLGAIDHMDCEWRNTNTAAGIHRARELFSGSDPAETERVIILVSDGAPQNQGAAENEADDAEDEGIHIFPVHLQQDYGSEANMRRLERGIGQYYGTADAHDLDDILLTILGALPILLVE